MSVDTTTYYTDSYPLRPDITGAPDQVFKFDNFLEHLLGGIKANTISAIGTLNAGSMCLQYLYAPQVHYDLSGTPLAIIGNSSNKKGEFSLIKIDMASFRLFAFVEAKSIIDQNLTHGDEIPTNYLSDTQDWKDFTDPLVGVLLPNFFFLYFGQKLPQGDVRDDDVMAKVARLGTGYDTWVTTAKVATEKLDDINSVLDSVTITTTDTLKTYFDPARNDKSLELALSNGPFGTMTLVQSDDYPAAARVVKSLFQVGTQSIAPMAQSPFPSGNVMLQLPSEIDKESEAKKGIIKLMLLHIGGDIDVDATTVTNVALATPSKGMQVVLNQPRAARASHFADLVRMTLDTAKNQDYTNIRSTQITLKVISKVLSSHILQGNFATEKVTSLDVEANSVEPSVFLPQRNKLLIDREMTNEVKATSENVMDFVDSHKTKGKTAIARIGTMTSMVDFSSLCINMDTIITAICSNDEPRSILRQLLLHFVAIVNNPDWVRWIESVGQMPHLHWYCYSYLERIFNCFADFATDFNNGNIMSENRPITELNTLALVRALTVMKTFRQQINLHQAQLIPITVMPATVAAYIANVSATGNARVKQDGQVAGATTPQKSSDEGSSTNNSRRGDKRDPGTPDTDEGKSSTRQQKKKARRAMKADTAAKEKKDLGMFYLKNPNTTPSDIFPKDMPEKICANFTCKGKECTNANCDFTHPRRASEMKRETILAIAGHFEKKDIGWFNEYHFMKMPDMTAEVKKLLGNTKGVTSKTA